MGVVLESRVTNDRRGDVMRAAILRVGGEANPANVESQSPTGRHLVCTSRSSDAATSDGRSSPHLGPPPRRRRDAPPRAVGPPFGQQKAALSDAHWQR